MYSAIDRATGDEVSAEHCLPRRSYTCPNCGERVVFRAGGFRAKHFAHAIGVADERCDLYVSSKVIYTGRRYHELIALDSKSNLQSGHLEFNVGPQGPHLALWLPPAGEDEWAGVIGFAAFRHSQTIKFWHLSGGQRVVFPLVDGQWAVTPDGDVSEEYLARIDIGSQSLATGQNLFDATRVWGRRILPGESIAAGDVVWWVSRAEITVPIEAEDFVRIECRSDTNGWFVYQITLISALDAGRDRDTVAAWVQRPIRPKPARVWIEEPWPWAHNALGIPIFQRTNKAFWIRADRDVDVFVRSIDTGDTVLDSESVRSAFWLNPQPGDWELVVNGRVHELFRVSVERIPEPSNVIVQIDGASTVEVAHIQTSLNEILASGRSSCRFNLAWGDDSVSDLIRVNGKPLQSRDDHCASVWLRPGSELHLDNLGALHWPLTTQVEAHVSEYARDMHSRAMWLLSVASSERFSGPERVRVPKRLQNDPVLRRLVSACWSTSFAPQVRTLQRLLGKHS